MSSDMKTKQWAEWDARQSPVGFYNLSLSYLDIADDLTERMHKNQLKLAFDAPVRHSYAHAWELALKACLFAQGFRPKELKTKFGHDVHKIWQSVDHNRFSQLRLTPETEQIAEHLGGFHLEKSFAYPVAGATNYLPLSIIKAESKRFRLQRIEIARLFELTAG